MKNAGNLKKVEVINVVKERYGRKQRTHYHPSFQLPRFSPYVLHTVLRKGNEHQGNSEDNGSCKHLHNDGYICQSYGGKEKNKLYKNYTKQYRIILF